MSLVAPFTGLRPAPGRAAEVLAPPYDVLDRDEAAALAAGAAMAVALILGFGLTALTGLAVLGAGELSGPLAPYMQGWSAREAHTLKEIHEFLAWATLALVPLHLAGVALASLQHRENLVRGMIDGYKRNEEA